MADRGIGRRDLIAAATLAASSSATARTAQATDGMGGLWDAGTLTQRGGGAIHSLSQGRGAPLVLLHKLGGWAADWRSVAPLLAAAGRRVIAVDLPGHGGSAMLGEPPYLQSAAESAAMVKAALDEGGIDQFDVVGCSLGGVVAVHMAAFWPGQVRRLGLLSVSLLAGVDRAELARQDAATPPGVYGPRGEPLPRSAAQTSKFGSLDPRVNAEANLSRSKAGLWVRPSERGVAVARTVEQLSRVKAPVLLIYGENGYYRQFEPVARAAVKDVRTVVIPRSGSFTQQEQPADTAAAISGFLS